jgi:predicted HicB family RNase H-like nuclease
MHLDGLLAELEGSVRSQIALAGGDPGVEAAAHAVMSALRPALQQAAFSLAEQAALEVNAQLTDQRVDVVLAEGEPVLKVSEVEASSSANTDQNLSARITVRIPESIKALVEDAADGTGASVNQFVVDALSRKVSQKPGRRRTQRGTMDI